MKIQKLAPKDGININHRKEGKLDKQYTLAAIYKGDLVEIAQLRIYYPNTKAYACLWVNDTKTNTHCNGSGSAGGYGYHKASAATQEAFNNAGVYTDKGMSGRGDCAIREGLTALEKKLGYRKIHIIEAHG